MTRLTGHGATVYGGETMTESEWLSSNEPARMLYLLRNGGHLSYHGSGRVAGATDRKFQLFAEAATGISAWANMGEGFNWSDLAVAVVTPERSSGSVPAPEVSSALLREIFGNPFRPIVRPRRLSCPCGGDFVQMKKDLMPLRSICPQCHREGPFWADVVKGAPWPWLTPDVRAIAAAIYEERRWGDVGVLADAMEEAGAEDSQCWSCQGYGTHLGHGPDRGNPTCKECGGAGRLKHPLVEHLRATVPCTRCWSLNGVRVVSEDGKPHGAGPCRRCDCRDGRRPAQHVAGCHVIDAILGKE